MDPDLRLDDWLDRTIDVIIDRPLGSSHPSDREMVYPLNSGYVPGTRAPDGSELDVYVLGPNTPVARVAARVIAVIRRRDDVEDKLVATTESASLCASEIAAAVAFQEQYFDSYIEMGAVSGSPPAHTRQPP